MIGGATIHNTQAVWWQGSIDPSALQATESGEHSELPPLGDSRHCYDPVYAKPMILEPGYEWKPTTPLNDMARDIRAENDHFYTDLVTGQPIKKDKGNALMLIVSEIAEAFEGERKNLMDDHLPHRKCVEVELADAVIRILDYAGEYKLDLDGAIAEKRSYNRTRQDHTREARLAANGKKW